MLYKALWKEFFCKILKSILYLLALPKWTTKLCIPDLPRCLMQSVYIFSLCLFFARCQSSKWRSTVPCAVKKEGKNSSGDWNFWCDFWKFFDEKLPLLGQYWFLDVGCCRFDLRKCARHRWPSWERVLDLPRWLRSLVPACQSRSQIPQLVLCESERLKNKNFK